jgi:hypothetical protein
MLGPESTERTWTGVGFASAAVGVLFVASVVVSVVRSPSELAFPPVVAAAAQAPTKFVAPRPYTAPGSYPRWSEVLQLELAHQEPSHEEYHFAGYSAR